MRLPGIRKSNSSGAYMDNSVPHLWGSLGASASGGQPGKFVCQATLALSRASCERQATGTQSKPFRRCVWLSFGILRTERLFTNQFGPADMPRTCPHCICLNLRSLKICAVPFVSFEHHPKKSTPLQHKHTPQFLNSLTGWCQGYIHPET